MYRNKERSLFCLLSVFPTSAFPLVTMSGDLAAFQVNMPSYEIDPAPSAFPVLDSVCSRVADFLAHYISAIPSAWSSFPSKEQINNLEAHLASMCRPRFVLSAVPGLTSFAVDTSVTAEDGCH